MGQGFEMGRILPLKCFIFIWIFCSGYIICYGASAQEKSVQVKLGVVNLNQITRNSLMSKDIARQIDAKRKAFRNEIKKEEEKLIMRHNLAKKFPQAKTILKTKDIISVRKVVKEVYMDEKIEQYILDIVFSSRNPEKHGLEKMKDYISFGGSPRASINLAKASKAFAFIKRRGYVIPEDVRAMCYDVLRHRIGLTYEAEAENISTEKIITEILNTVEIP